MVAVADFLRRTPVARALPAGSWGSLGDAAVLARAGTADLVGDLAVADLSPLPRLGFKGRDTIEAMKRQGLVVESAPNRTFRQPDGELCLVLGAGEVLLLGAPGSANARLKGLEAGWRIDDGERTYPVPRRDSHAWFAIAGAAAPAMFAKLCSVDFRLHTFADLSIAQTSVARLNAIVMRADRNGQPTFNLLADSASAVYLLGCVLDAAQEFSGTLVGLDALRP